MVGEGVGRPGSWRRRQATAVTGRTLLLPPVLAAAVAYRESRRHDSPRLRKWDRQHRRHEQRIPTRRLALGSSSTSANTNARERQRTLPRTRLASPDVGAVPAWRKVRPRYDFTTVISGSGARRRGRRPPSLPWRAQHALAVADSFLLLRDRGGTGDCHAEPSTLLPRRWIRRAGRPRAHAEPAGRRPSAAEPARKPADGRSRLELVRSRGEHGHQQRRRSSSTLLFGTRPAPAPVISAAPDVDADHSSRRRLCAAYARPQRQRSRLPPRRRRREANVLGRRGRHGSLLAAPLAQADGGGGFRRGRSSAGRSERFRLRRRTARST